ncbi:MAG: bifunctional diguanylate cyclase/phosphodiesterase [Mycobacteriales bacterium]
MASGGRSLRALVAATVLLGGSAAAVIWARYAGDGIGRTAHFTVFAAALVTACLIPLPVPRGEQLEDLELEEPFIVAILMVLPPLGVLLAALTGALAGNIGRRREPIKFAFNVGMIATAAGLALLVRAAVLGDVPLGSASAGRTVVAGVGSALVFVTYKWTSVYAAIAFAGQRPFLDVARESIGVGALVTTSGISVGVALGLATRAAWWAPLTLLPPGVVVLLLLRDHLQALRDRQRLDGLLRAAAHAHASIDIRHVTESLLESARELLRAGEVEIRDRPAGDDELGARVDDGASARWLVAGHRHHLDPFERGEQELLDGLATIGTAALSNARLVEQVEHQIVHDSVTDLPNRLLFEDRVSQAAARGRQFGERFAVVFLDIDRFKRVNDSLGHGLGDDLLRETAARLLAAVGPTDTVARTGGDEFTVLLAGATDPLVTAVSILDRLRAPFQLGGRQLFVTASAGVAVYPQHGTDPATLLAHADAALQQAKDSGRDTAAQYEGQVALPAARGLQLESLLHHAVERGEMWLAYQPLVDLRRGVAIGAEALLRWSHPTLGEIGPDDFLPIAEQSGLVSQLDTFALLSACRQARAWNIGRGPYEPMHVAVNFSARQLHSPRVIDIVTDSLAATGLPAQLLEVEITERLAGGDSPEVTAVLTQLRAVGVRIAMDDFGTGYSSLSRLEAFPLDNVKIDKSFVRRIAAPGDEAPIVVAAIAMAHGLGLTVTAEGVESRVQLDYLQRHGCDLVQGYLLGRPQRGGPVPTSLLDAPTVTGSAAGRTP